MISGAIKAKKYNIPLILEANEVSGIKDRARKQSFQWLCSIFERYLFRRCISIHTVSSYLKNMIIHQGVDESAVEVIPNAIDPDKFSGVKDSGNLLEKYKLENKTVIGFAGWFDNWDRLDLLINIYRSIKAKRNDLALVLVGDGEVLNHVREEVEKHKLEDVILTGAVTRDTVHQYLSLLDIAVITHSNEFGSPVVMFEFMGLKIPIIAPKLLPITDVLKNDETAMLFDVLDMDQLEKQVVYLLENKKQCEKLSENAYELLMSQHTWLQNAEHIIESSRIFTRK